MAKRGRKREQVRGEPITEEWFDACHKLGWWLGVKLDIPSSVACQLSYGVLWRIWTECWRNLDDRVGSPEAVENLLGDMPNGTLGQMLRLGLLHKVGGEIVCRTMLSQMPILVRNRFNREVETRRVRRIKQRHQVITLNSHRRSMRNRLRRQAAEPVEWHSEGLEMDLFGDLIGENEPAYEKPSCKGLPGGAAVIEAIDEMIRDRRGVGYGWVVWDDESIGICLDDLEDPRIIASGFHAFIQRRKYPTLQRFAQHIRRYP